MEYDFISLLFLRAEFLLLPLLYPESRLKKKYKKLYHKIPFLVMDRLHCLDFETGIFENTLR